MRRAIAESGPGAVRRWWWAASQRTRLTVASLATVAGMAACVLALSPLQTVPYLHAFGLTENPSPGPTQGAVAVQRDAVITIVSMDAVDALDGTDRSNHPVLLRVPEIRSVSPCWAGPALDAAAQLIRGKEVILSDLGEVEAGRVAARIQLPDGRDYAQAVVSAGAATAADDELAKDQDEARQARRGVWGATCVPAGTGTPPPPPPKPRPTSSSPTTAPPSTSGPPTTPPDGVQQGVRQGAPCSPEGAFGLTARGQLVVCTTGIDGKPRWRKV